MKVVLLLYAQVMKKECRKTGQPFEITHQFEQFLEKISPVFEGKKYQLPHPTLCPTSRAQRRLVWRNEKKLYNRKCDATGKQIVSIYRPELELKVYDRAEWWSDRFDGKKYGRDFNQTKPFFEQFFELYREVPKMSLLNNSSENSDYTNVVSHNKDCYMIFSSDYNRNCHYSDWLLHNEDCCESVHLRDSQFCTQCIYCEKAYGSLYCIQCSDIRESLFCFQCRNVSNCMFCVNVRNKEYMIFNKQYTKEEYMQKKAELNLGSYTTLKWALNEFKKMRENAIVPATIWEGKNENVSGNYISNSKDVIDSYDIFHVQNALYCGDAWDGKDYVDCNYVGFNELAYETLECVPNPQGSICNINCYGGANVMYSIECMYSKNCFGCVSLKRAEYCIFNKQYTKEEYETLVPKIIEHMKQTGEWGEFFPAKYSPFGYNETNAQDWFPLTKDRAISEGFTWANIEEKTPPVADNQHIFEASAIPDNIAEVDESITKKIFLGEKTGKPFKIIPQELALYLKHNLALPRDTFEQRLRDRKTMQNPRTLWQRNCLKCAKEMQSTYAPERTEKVYCRECYEGEVV